MKYEDELKKWSEQMNGQTGPSFAEKTQKNVSRIVTASLVSGLLLTVGIGVVVYFTIQGAMTYIEEEVEMTTSFSGDPTAFDPVERLSEVQAHAGPDTRLTEIEARLVKSDGTLDLMADYSPAPRVEYTFYHVLDTPPPNVAPTGATQWYEQVTVDAYEPGQRRFVSSMGGDINMEYIYYNQGLDKEVGSPTSSKPSQEFVEPPTCHFSDLWATAIQEGASPEYVADITYDDDGYEFRIRDAQIRLNFNTNCQLESS